MRRGGRLRRCLSPRAAAAARQVMGGGRWSGSRLSRTPKGSEKFGGSNSWVTPSSSGTVCVCVFLSSCRLMDLSAASDVERMHVSRDQHGVSAMQVIVTGSVIVKRKPVTRLLLWTLFGNNITVFGSSSMKAGQVFGVLAKSGLKVSAVW